MSVKMHDIIQLTEKAQKGWIACVMVVEEVRSWGVLAYTKIPKHGDAYLRVPHGHFEVVGHAVLVHPEEREQDSK